LVIEHLDQSIRGRDDVEATLQLPGLAVIPKLDNAILPARVRKALTSSSNGSTNGASKQVSAKLVTLNDSRSVGAEAYRTLRTKLLFSRALSSLKTIVVTSPFAQDGKSTVAANLATTFAQHGMRTLLIDCDLRRPTQHEVFGVSSRPGLTDLLTSDELIPGAGRRTSVENLSLITAGPLPPDPPELVGSARMRSLLEKLGETFDVIVLDTPPVLPVADSAILASLSDGVLLVVRAGQTDRRAAQLAVQQLQDVDARILGAVLNDPNEQVPLYDTYGYATYYGYATKE
jgi:capsular exopolysaccharide synthesis family protein